MNQSTINNLIITLLSTETMFISGLTKLETLQDAVQHSYTVIKSLPVQCDSFNNEGVYNVIREVAGRYDVELN